MEYRLLVRLGMTSVQEAHNINVLYPPLPVNPVAIVPSARTSCPRCALGRPTGRAGIKQRVSLMLALGGGGYGCGDCVVNGGGQALYWKSQKTPKRELKTARKRLSEFRDSQNQEKIKR